MAAQTAVFPAGGTVASTGAAGQQRAPLTLVQVLDIAHHTNPSLLAGADHLSAVRAQEITAGLRQNPTALLQGQMFTLKPGDPNGTEFYLAGVQRLFERGNKRDLRLKGARSGTALTSYQFDDQRRQTDLAIRQAFSRMLYAQLALGISQENLGDYRKTVQLMQIRLDAGAVDRTDFERVELQLSGFESDADNAALTLRQSSISLQSLIGVSQPADDFAIVGTLDPPPVSATLDSLKSHALAERPDLKAAEEQVTTNEAAAKLAIANGTADPTLETEFERAGSTSTFGATVNIPLRFFDRNQGEKERTRFEANSSRFALTAARNQVLSDVDSAWAGYQTAQSQSARYRSKYLAEAAHVRDNLEFSYRNGNGTLLDYLSALSDYRQVNLASLSSELNLLLALEQLSYAAQMEIVP